MNNVQIPLSNTHQKTAFHLSLLLHHSLTQRTSLTNVFSFPLTTQVERLTENKEDSTDSGLLECRVVAGAPREWLCAYIPLVVGLYEVRIFTSSGPLPGSPFSVKVRILRGTFL